jgi:hypothetical protein
MEIGLLKSKLNDRHDVDTLYVHEKTKQALYLSPFDFGNHGLFRINKLLIIRIRIVSFN